MLDIEYEQIVGFDIVFQGETIQILTKAGISNWDQFTPVQALLAENARPQGDTLLLGSDHGGLAVALSLQGPESLSCSDENAIALELTRRTFQANDLPPVRCISPLELGGPYETVIIRLPKGRKLARRWLLDAYSRLKEGGSCYLGGANSEGIQSVLKDANQLFDGVGILRYRKGCRVARMIKGDTHSPLPNWVGEPGIAPGSWVEFDLEITGKSYRMRSLPGVFSFNHLDPGSRMLLEHMNIPEGGRVLDFGCGCGVLGLAAVLMGADRVDLVDASLLAVAAAQENLRVHAPHAGRVLASDLLDAVQDQRYERIITNPPFHAGKAVDKSITQAFLRQAQKCLAPGGELILVANRFLRYDLFGQVTTLAADNKYHILSLKV